MRTGTTKSGFKYTIDASVIESWDFMELLAEVDDNPLKAVNLLKMILDDKQITELKEHLGGKPKASEMFTILNEILVSLGDDSKN